MLNSLLWISNEYDLHIKALKRGQGKEFIVRSSNVDLPAVLSSLYLG